MPQSILEQALNSQEQQRQQQVLTQAPEAAPVDYDRAARIFYVQGKTKLPSEVIDADLDNLYEKVKREEFNYDNYTDQLNGSPIFNSWAAEDPYNASVVERDRRNLTLFERQADALHRGAKRGDAMLELSRVSGRRRRGDKREGDEEIMADLRELTGAGSYGLDGLAAVLVETGVQGMIQKHLLAESWEMAAGGAAVGGAAGLMAGPAAPITAPAAAGIGAAVGWRTATYQASKELEQNLAYDEYIERGASEEDARFVSELVGVANGSLEMIGLGFIMKNVPGVNKVTGGLGKSAVEKMFVKPTFKQAMARVTYRYGESMGGEVITEIIQESFTIAGAEYLKKEMREAGDFRPETAPLTWDQFTDQVAEIAIQTMRGTAIIGGIGPGYSFMNDVSRANQARQNGAFIRALGEASEDSETRKNVPGKFKEFLQRQQEKGPITELRFQLDAWNDYWVSQGMDVGQITKALGIDLDELQATGSDVVLSLEVFGEKLAHTEHFKELWKDARLRPDELTYREAKQFLSDPDKHIAKLKEDLGEAFGEEASDDMERIVEDVTGQLMSPQLNFDRPAAEKQAKLMAAVFTTQALRNPDAGVTPWGLYTERFGGVRADVTDPAHPPGTFDPSIDPLLDRIRKGDFPSTRSIYGESLVDFVISKGGLVDDGGELSARDYKELRRGIIRSKGDTLDGMAEAAHEAGYIPSRDPNLLLEMMDRELRSEAPVYSESNVNAGLQGLNEDLERLHDYLLSEGLDVENMTNQQIRETLAGRARFEQIETEELKNLTSIVLQALNLSDRKLAEAGKELYKDAADIDRSMARAAAMLPLVSEEQDFGDLEFTDRVRLKGKPGTRKRKAQKVFDQEVKKRNMLKTLMDCLGGSK